MLMPDGCTMSMMASPGPTWPGIAAFLGMWIAMMVPMMLPSLIPMLLRYRHAVSGARGMRLTLLTALVGVAYFLVWTACGAAAYVAGVAVAGMEMPHLPLAAAVIVLVAGVVQFTGWKARHLECCREAPGPGRQLPADARTAWRHGLSLGLHCCYSCADLMAILLAIGAMDVRGMVVVTAAITLERLAPAGQRAAHAIGAVAIASGLFLIARATGFG
jgi:predicted metal-binding membrane protein